MTITDICKCGAEFQAEDSRPPLENQAQTAHAKWLTAHEYCRKNLFVTTTYKPATSTEEA